MRVHFNATTNGNQRLRTQSAGEDGRKVAWPCEPPDWARDHSPIVRWKPHLKREP